MDILAIDHLLLSSVSFVLDSKILKEFCLNILTQYNSAIFSPSSGVVSHSVMPFQIVRRFLPGMLSKPHGHIVCVSSMLGLNAFSGVSDYAGSKAAVVRFTESLREELLADNAEHVNVTLVCPHHINTNLFAGCKVRSVTSCACGDLPA